MTIREFEVQTFNGFRLVLMTFATFTCFSKCLQQALPRFGVLGNYVGLTDIKIFSFLATRLKKQDGDIGGGKFPKQLKSLTRIRCQLVYVSSGSWPFSNLRQKKKLKTL